MAILGINYAPEVTGIAPYSTRLAEGLMARGHDVRVVTSFPHYPHWRFDSETEGFTHQEILRGVRVKRVRHYLPARPQGALRALSEVSFGLRLLASRWGVPDVVVCPSPALLSTAMAAARSSLSRAALGVIVQDLYSAGIAETGTGGARVEAALGMVERRVLLAADGVSVIHDRFKSRVVDAFDVDPDRVTVIRNWTHVPPVPDFDRAAFRRELGWQDDETIVLHTGAMGEKQALGNVVEAARVADVQGAPVRFVLAGDGGQRSRLEALARGVERVQFVDPLPGDVYGQAMRAADVLLVNEKPGVVEMAVPSKLTSYFSTGRPVLAATDPLSTTAAEIEASGAGVRIDPGSPEGLMLAAVSMGSDPARLSQIGSNGPAYCATVLSEGAALDAYDDWVRRLHALKTRG